MNLATRTLRVYEGDQPIRQFSVLVGDSDHPTPQGSFHITEKYVPKDNESYLGPAWMGYYETSDSMYGLHGTTPGQVGYREHTEGCVALENHDAAELYGLVDVDDTVVIEAALPGLEQFGGAPPLAGVLPPTDLLSVE